MVASQDGTVAFAGWVGGQLYISIDHPDGVRTTYSYISAASVKKGDHVLKGQAIGLTGHGHPDVATPHLHFGARIGSTYIDPMLLLGAESVVGLIWLAPVTSSGPAVAQPASTLGPEPGSGWAIVDGAGSVPVRSADPGAPRMGALDALDRVPARAPPSFPL
jgi:hypothetical protein